MHEAEQFELTMPERSDLDVALENQWRRNEIAQAEYWGPDCAVIYWWAGGSWDREGWDRLPEYERTRWRHAYEGEISAPRGPGFTRRTASQVAAADEENYRQMRAMAERWVAEIRNAFLERRPCPIRPTPEFESVLLLAFQMAQVPQECLAAAEPFEVES